jgi:hypothetical protein
MITNIERISFYIMAFLALTLSQKAFSEYVEGIDTTDTNGYGLDSAFKIGPGVTGQKLVCYTDHEYGPNRTIFKYSFEEIQLSADSLSLSSILIWPGPFAFTFPNYIYCFVVCKDSCFSKVQVVNRVGNRYVYKYGTNKTPSNRIMQYTDYDRSVRYKPNNLYYLFDVNASHNNNIFAWEPPLSNDLQGYIIYVQKRGVTIDTTAPISISQWDSVGFSDTTKFAFNYSAQGEYYNIVAVYSEGKSDFLKGWSRLYSPSHVTNGLLSEKPFNKVSIHGSKYGFFISLNQRLMPSMLNIYDVTGKRLARFSDFTGNRIVWTTSEQYIPVGLYLLRAEFPDRSVITQPFTVTR